MRGVLLAVAGQNRWTIRELAAVVYDTPEPTDWQRRSVTRAVHSLEAAGRVRADLVPSLRSRPTRARIPMPGLVVRPVVGGGEPAWVFAAELRASGPDGVA